MIVEKLVGYSFNKQINSLNVLPKLVATETIKLQNNEMKIKLSSTPGHIKSAYGQMLLTCLPIYPEGLRDSGKSGKISLQTKPREVHCRGTSG